jgi:enoyl-CoA hydratase
MAEPSVRIEMDGPVAVITISRAERRNAVDGPTAEELRAAFETFEADDALDVAVLTGSGGTFCAGADLTAIGDPERGNRAEATGRAHGPMGPTRMIFTKPVIAAVEGHAVAGGLELACMCDMRVAAETAVFGVFCRRWGVPLIDGGTVRLPRIVGQGHAMDMILTGRPVSAHDALAMGLANRIVPEGQALATARKLAKEIAAFPQACLRADRASALAQWDQPLADALAFEGANGFPIIAQEAVAGARRFAAGAGRHGRFDDHGEGTQ